jgi:N-acetylmuramoyl-L-alanine amidase
LLKFKPLKQRSSTNLIVLHHSVSSKMSIEDIHRDHLAKGWAGIGYHFFIEKTGLILNGRPKNTIGSHCKTYNDHSIGICLQGNFEIEYVTEKQMSSLNALIQSLLKEYPKIQIKLHRELRATKCPGENFNWRFTN